MDIKKVFFDLGYYFRSALYDRPLSQEEFLRLALDDLFPDQRRELEAALTEILDGRYSDAELDAIWKVSNTDFAFIPGAIRRSLTRARDWLAQHPRPPASE